MPARFLLHVILLIIATFGIFLWLSSPFLTPYTLQLVAVLVLLYVGSHYLRAKHPKWFHKSTITLDITILTSMIILLVAETGALTSPFFFLCYFLLFGVALLYEIEATLVLTGVLILFFLFLPGTSLTDLAHLSELVALVMITPLAIFTGHQYESSLEEKRIRDAISTQLSQEETDTLLFISLNLKKTLLGALDSLSVTIPMTKAKEVRQNLEILYGDLKALYRTSTDLKDTLEKSEDNIPKT